LEIYLEYTYKRKGHLEENHSPYKQEFHPFFNKKNIIILGIFIIAIVLVILFFITTKKRSNLEEVYIGKVVEISGDINQVGLVKEFHADDYILIVPLNMKKRDPIYQKLKGKYSINIIAEDEIQYFKSKKKKIKPLSSQKDILSAKAENKVASAYTDYDRKKLNEDLKKLRTEKELEADIKKESDIYNENKTEIDKDSKKTSENFSYLDLENEILDKIEQEFQDVYERIYKMFFLEWDKFTMGCLISNTSREKYSKGRRWFLYLEDLVQRADQLERVGEQVELEHLKSVDDPRPYDSEKVRYLDTTECRMHMTSLFEKIRYIKEAFEWSKDFSTKNGLHFSRVKVLWNRYFREYSEWYDLVVEWEGIEKAYKIFHEIEKPRW
jgi:hypothetical protein